MKVRASRKYSPSGKSSPCLRKVQSERAAGGSDLCVIKPVSSMHRLVQASDALHPCRERVPGLNPAAPRLPRRCGQGRAQSGLAPNVWRPVVREARGRCGEACHIPHHRAADAEMKTLIYVNRTSTPLAKCRRRRASPRAELLPLSVGPHGVPDRLIHRLVMSALNASSGMRIQSHRERLVNRSVE